MPTANPNTQKSPMSQTLSPKNFSLGRRQFLAGLVGAGFLSSLGCRAGRGFSLFGYSTESQFDSNIRSVYVRMFANKVFQAGPYRGSEFILTRYVVDEIEKRTPWKVISDPDSADTELQATMTTLTKNVLVRTPFNGSREIEITAGAEVVWRDLRTGVVLSNPRPTKTEELTTDIPAFDPTVPRAKPIPAPPQPVYLQEVGRGYLEVGETSTTALQMALKRLAVKIVNVMEQPW